MSDKKDDGGPAFPFFRLAPALQGMSLRDWFAGQALSIFGDARTLSALRSVAEEDKLSKEEAMAIAAYELADAMLKERAK